MKNKGFMVITITLLIVGGFSACSTTPGVEHTDIPIDQQVLVTIEEGDFSLSVFDSFKRLAIGRKVLSLLWLNTSGQHTILIPAGKQRITGEWKREVAIDQYTTGTKNVTVYEVTSRGFNVEYDFVAGKKYRIKLPFDIEEKGNDASNGVAVTWSGTPSVYYGYMFPNTAGAAFGLTEGVEILTSKVDMRVGLEGTVGLGIALSHPTDSSHDDLLFTFPFTGGLRVEYFATKGLAVSLGGGVTSAWLPGDGVLPITPYAQFQVNFRPKRIEGYPSYPLLPIGIYFNYYPVVSSDQTVKFGAGIKWIDF
jgi:hypothetical protein